MITKSDSCGIAESMLARTIKLRFPYPIKQTGDFEISVPCKDMPEMFTPVYVHELEQAIGKRDASKILDDAANDLMLKALVGDIRIG